MKTKRNVQWLIGLGIMVMFLLVACGGNTVTTTPATSTATTSNPAESIAPSEKINLNNTNKAQLQATIPDFSDRMVREFNEYAPYVSIQQFRREMGKYVGDDVIAGYEQYVYVPININDSDADTIMQIPGVDETIANALIAARPYASNDAFLAKLDEYALGEDVALAATYLSEQ